MAYSYSKFCKEYHNIHENLLKEGHKPPAKVLFGFNNFQEALVIMKCTMDVVMCPYVGKSWIELINAFSRRSISSI